MSNEFEKIPETKIVVLVHGIRTHADWFSPVRRCLIDSGFEVQLTNYGRFDLIRFLLPFSYFRRRSRYKLVHQLRDTRNRNPNADISVIAHSFGTYLLAEALQTEFDLKLDRIIFTGSVVRYDFPFESVPASFADDILNEVGTKDMWPVLAESITTGYGSAGTFGFKRPGVYDVWHATTHSEILTPQQCKKSWIPFLLKGTLPTDTGESKVPIWIQLISIFKLKWFLVTTSVMILVLVTLAGFSRSDPYDVQMFPGGEGWSLSDNDLAKDTNKAIGEECYLETYLYIDCNSALGRYLTQRQWREVKFYDSDLNRVKFRERFELSSQDPLNFWQVLSRRYPECILLQDDGRSIELHRGTECGL